MSQFWRLDAQRQPTGPYSEATLSTMHAQGALTGADLLCAVSSTEWVPADHALPQLFARQTNTIAPPPPLTQAPAPPPIQAPRVVADDAMLGYLVPYRVSAIAIAAGYAGLLSPLIFPAPIALVLGIIALRQLRADPKARGLGRALCGIILGGLGTIALLPIVLIRLF